MYRIILVQADIISMAEIPRSERSMNMSSPPLVFMALRRQQFQPRHVMMITLYAWLPETRELVEV